MNISKVIFELDASSVISAVSEACHGGVMGLLVQSIQSVKSVFSCCSFSHVKRDYNKAAHELAQFAKCNQATNLWKGFTPPFLAHLLHYGLG